MARRVLTLAAALAFGGGFGRPAEAGAVTFTGNVETDMPYTPGGANNGVFAVPGLQPNQVAQDSWITQNGWINGWVIKDMRFDYNATTNTMQVGVNFYSIAGDADGNPTGKPAPQSLLEGLDPASLGGRKSISVEFAAPAGQGGAQVGAPVIVAGVPEDKMTSGGTGTDQFTVAAAGGSAAIQDNYGKQINAAMGSLAFDPSPAHPDFEFTIKNWSQFSTLAGSNGFWVSAYAGSPDDVVAGESKIPWAHIPVPLSPGEQVSVGPGPPPVPTQVPHVPEPTTVAGWSLMAGCVVWALRRSRQTTDKG